MYAEITPLDTVFFRDGSPFTMGEETWGESRFPPPPSVVYGALRTRYFAEHPAQLNEAGPEGPTSDARLTSLHLRRSGNPYFPLPRDLVEPEEKKEKRKQKGGGTEVSRLRSTTMPGGGAGLGASPYVLSHPDEVSAVREAFLGEDDLEAYLHREKETFLAYDLYKDNFVHREPKIGIRMDRNTRAADDGFLYRVGMHRLGNRVSFGVGVDNLSLGDSGLLKLGGEGKGARYTVQSGTPPVPDPPQSQIAENGAFILYLATPAVFSNGWLPGWIDPASLKGAKNGVTVCLQAAAVGKPGAVGGWNMKKGRPRPLHRTVPAGSVYHFALDDGSAQDVTEAFHDERIGNKERHCRSGFGHAFVGAAPDVRERPR